MFHFHVASLGIAREVLRSVTRTSVCASTFKQTSATALDFSLKGQYMIVFNHADASIQMIMNRS